MYQSIYQILATAIPLITSPYISRVIGSSGLGIYSYTSSIVTYFSLFAMLGVNNYGSRSIAIANSNRAEVSKTFWEIYTLQCILTLVAISVYIIYFICFDIDNPLISILQSITIFNCFLDINWLYFGLEKIKITVTRNIIVKALTLCGIFWFVHNPEDLWKYTLIMVCSTLISEIVLFWNIKDNVDFVKIKITNVFKHFKPNFLLYIPILALSIFHYMDKTMLGALSTYEQSGYYYNADKIINIPLGIINGLGTVILPRASIFSMEKDKNKINKLFEKTFELVFFISSAIVFGILSISGEFTTWFFGNEYVACVELLNILVFVVYFKAISQIIRMQYLIPTMKNKEYIKAIFTGALFNFIMNYYLIQTMGAKGAVISTVISEAIVCIWHLLDVKKEISVFSIIRKNWFYIIAGCIMLITVRGFVKLDLNLNTTLEVLIEILLGSLTYILVCLIYWFYKKQGLFYNTILSKINHIRGIC